VLEQYLKQQLARKDVLLMTHIVMGHPDFDTSLRLVDVMVTAGVELMELQIPFSEPMADGPVIMRANQSALNAGATVDRCFAFAEGVTRRFDIPFLFMTYYNVVFRRGVEHFAKDARDAGVQGTIVPDLPLEESKALVAALRTLSLDPIFIFSPTSSEARMRAVAQQGSGLIYCAARTGVTGAETRFSSDLSEYLERARRATQLPLAVGFGVKDRQDVSFLRGKADIAVVGSETLRVLERSGVDTVGSFLRGLRAQ
jgi:tryptophan synthase alpha chain